MGQGVTMKTIYIASGFNSLSNKSMVRAFATKGEADQFLQGLTDPILQVMTYKNTVDLLNAFLKG
jgi:hypothetical protein